MRPSRVQPWIWLFGTASGVAAVLEWYLLGDFWMYTSIVCFCVAVYLLIIGGFPGRFNTMTRAGTALLFTTVLVLAGIILVIAAGLAGLSAAK